MAALTQQAIEAGAFAFSTNRIAMHTSTDGESVPGTFAEKEEVLAIIKAMQDGGANLLQVVPEGLMGENPTAFQAEVQLYKELSLETGCSIVFTLSQNNVQTTLWKDMLEEISQANKAGAKLYATTGNRPGGMLMSWDTFNIFMDRPSYLEVAHLPLAKRVKALQDPERREKILNEEIQSPLLKNGAQVVRDALNAIFPCKDQQIFEPDRAQSLAARLLASNDTAEGVLYDAMCEVVLGDEGRPGFLHVYMGNYADGDLNAVYEMMMHPNVVVGAADGGAHVNVICDASYTTFMLQHWVRDRQRGDKLPLEIAIQMLTKTPSDLYGLHDRGVIEVGKKADINVIALNDLSLQMPYVANDLPTGAPRLLQRAEGYVATMVAGQIINRNGHDSRCSAGPLVMVCSDQIPSRHSAIIGVRKIKNSSDRVRTRDSGGVQSKVVSVSITTRGIRRNI